MPDLDLPIPGVTPGPEWATKNNAALNALNDVMETGRLSEQGLQADLVAIASQLNPEALSDEYIANQLSTSGTQTNSAIKEILAPIVIRVDSTSNPNMLVDAGAELSSILAAAPSGSTVDIAPGSYPVTSGCTVDMSSKTLNVVARGVTLVRQSGSGILFEASGSYDPQLAISSLEFVTETINGISTGVTRITYPSPPSYVPGDWVKILSDDAIPGGRQTSSTSFPRLGEHLFVYSVSGNVVTFIGQMFEKEAYLTNVRTAKIRSGNFTLEGMKFDVSESILSSALTAQAVMRCTALIAPKVSNVEVIRAVGPAVRMRSCVNYIVTGLQVGWGVNNGGSILGYGFHDNASQGGVLHASNFRFVRHAYDDKTDDSSAGDTVTYRYGRTLFPTVSACQAWYTSDASFSTHQESYGVTFVSPIVRGTGVKSGIALRGSGHKVNGANLSNVDVGVTIVTETGYPSGESRKLSVNDLTVENATFAVSSNIRSGSTHVSAGVQDVERTMSVQGLVARNVRGIGLFVNSKIFMSDLDVQIANNPAKNFFSVQNSELVLGGVQWIRATDVTVSEFTDHSLISPSTPSGSVSPRNRLVQMGQMHYEPSSYIAARHSGGLVNAESNTDYDFPQASSLSVYSVISAGVFSATAFRKQCTFGWRYVPHIDNPSRYEGSSAITLTNSQLAGTTGVATLTSAPDENLLLVAVMSDNTDRTLSFLPSGRRRGQRLSVLRAGGTANLTVVHGSAGGTSLTGGTNAILGNGSILNLMWVGSSWRQI